MREEPISKNEQTPDLLEEVKRLSSKLLDVSNEANELREYALVLGHSFKHYHDDDDKKSQENIDRSFDQASKNSHENPAALESVNNVNGEEEGREKETDSEEKNEENEFLIAVKTQASSEGWLIQPSEIKLCEVIGHGSTADIYKGVWHGLDVAVKCMKQSFFESDKSGKKSFAREVQLLARIRHPYILRLFGVCLVPRQHYWMITEILSDRTVMEWLHGSRKRQWNRSIPLPPLHLRLQIAHQLSLAIQYLHEQRPIIMHRDVKPSNVFVDVHGCIRLADFGFARSIPPTDEVLTGETGTYMYMAPEVIRHERYTEKCDVFSFGVMLNELASGNPPYVETYFTPFQIASSVSKGELRPTLTATLEARGLPNLVTACWAQDPASRPTFAYIASVLKNMYEQVMLETGLEQRPQGLAGILGMVQNLGKIF